MAGESTLELVTGYRGKAHVTADDARALNAGIVGSGTYVLPEGKGLAAEMIDSNTLRVQSGTLLIQGCQCRVRAGESVDVKIRNGSQAMKRNDIVVARWEKQAAEPRTESVELKVIEGTPSSKAAEDPAHTEGDLSSDLVAEFPLWRIPLDGIAVGTPVPLYKKLVSVDALGDSVSPIEEQVFGGLTVEGAARGGSVTIHVVGNDVLTTTQGVKVGSVKDAYRPKVPARAIFGIQGTSWGIVSVDADGIVKLIHRYGNDSLTWGTVDVSVSYTL